MDPLDVCCPRCGQYARQPFYGPCPDCRTELRRTLSGNPEQEPSVTPEYEPKVNVTPNAVALRDD